MRLQSPGSEIVGMDRIVTVLTTSKEIWSPQSVFGPLGVVFRHPIKIRENLVWCGL